MDNYIVWSLGEGDKKQGGGFRPFQEGESQSGSARVVVYFEVADIPAALAQITSLGGEEKMAKMGIGEHGFIGIFTDPAGNTVGLWSKA